MTRREMLLGLISMLGLSGAQILVSCQSSESGNSGDLTATSTNVGHTHQFTITAEELASPVAISRADSTTPGHSHTVTLTAAQVTSIAAGTAVSATSSTTATHSHGYTFQLT
jgi:hypothetical protein